MVNAKCTTHEERFSSYGDFISYANSKGLQKLLEFQKDLLRKFEYISASSLDFRDQLTECLLGSDFGYEVLCIVKRVNPEVVSVVITTENKIIRNDNFIILEDDTFVVALQPREKELFFLLAKKKRLSNCKKRL